MDRDVFCAIAVFFSTFVFAPHSQAWDSEAESGSLAALTVPEGSDSNALPDIASLKSDWDFSGDIQFDKALSLAELSVLAYNDGHSRTLTARLLGFKEIVLLDEGPMSGFMARDGDLTVVVFRGTNVTSPRDWMTNLNFYFQTRIQGDRKFHDGFQSAYSRFSNQIKMTLRDWKPKYLWLTGHSLGGAMSVCCAYDCLGAGIPITGLVTFGQPRVANRSMANFLNAELSNRYLRFLNHQDLIPSVPANGPEFLSDYQHAGQTAWINGGAIERNERLMQSSLPPPSADSEMTAGQEESDEEPMDELAKLFAEPPAESVETNRAENQITTDELNDLQYFLRTATAANGSEEIVERPFVAYGATPHSQSSVPVRSSLQTTTVELQSFVSRFSDHSMFEYVRVLNEHNSRSE